MLSVLRSSRNLIPIQLFVFVKPAGSGQTLKCPNYNTDIYATSNRCNRMVSSQLKWQAQSSIVRSSEQIMSADKYTSSWGGARDKPKNVCVGGSHQNCVIL